MNKLITAFITLTFFFMIIELCVSDGTALSSTKTTAAITSTATDFTTTVRDTSGFPEVGYFDIGDESIEYNGITDTTFLHCEHGYNNTDASAHDIGSQVYSADTSKLNSALGFNVTSADTPSGLLGIPVWAGKFLTNTVPKMVSMDYVFLNSGPLQIVKGFLLCFSTGFIFMVVYMIVSGLGGIAQSIFIR